MTDKILHDIGSGVCILSLTISDFWKSQGEGFELFRVRIHKQVTNEKKADRWITWNSLYDGTHCGDESAREF
jgi:hypothetical protein